MMSCLQSSMGAINIFHAVSTMRGETLMARCSELGWQSMASLGVLSLGGTLGFPLPAAHGWHSEALNFARMDL